jgi:hypothetical protein
LVGTTHAETARGVGRDARIPPRVGGLVERDAEPGRVAADAARSSGSFSPIARGEHQRVEPAQRGGERAELAADAVHEELDREFRARVPALLELAHVVGDARDAEQAGLVVEQLLDRLRVHAVALHEIEQDAGIERAGARAHRQPVEAVKPIVLATLLPALTAHMLAPEPR